MTKLAGWMPGLRRPIAVAATTVCALTLAGCAVNVGGYSVGGHSDDSGGSTSSTVENATHTTPPATVRMSPRAGQRITWDSHPTFRAHHGTITSVRVQSAHHDRVRGSLRNAHTWRATSRLVPGNRYTATVHLQSVDGHPVTRHLRFRTAPADEVLSMSATPGPNWTRGVGEAVKVNFNRAVPDRAAVEKHMFVTTSHGRVAGSWHWFSDSVAHFRPRHFWPANTKVTVHVDLADLYAGDGVWGDRDHDWSWQVGDSHISYVDANTHRFRVTVNGKQVANWPTGMGQPGFETRSGTYNVLMKTPLTEMDSCSVGLGCDKSSPTYYDLQVHWDVRLTTSGTFVHAAPWDSQLGAANTSHGCIHLSTADAKQFYDLSVPGDVVIVKGTDRPANPSDPGMMDWAVPYQQWAN